jgi:hypothetical protein
LVDERETVTLEVDWTLSPEICRASRAWLGWTQKELATKAEVAVNTIREFESARRELNSHSHRRIHFAISNGGLQFLWSGETPIGIYMPQASKKRHVLDSSMMEHSASQGAPGSPRRDLPELVLSRSENHNALSKRSHQAQ